MRLAQDEAELGRSVDVNHRHENGAQVQRAEVEQRRFDRRRHLNREPVARAHARGVQADREALGALQQLGSARVLFTMLGVEVEPRARPLADGGGQRLRERAIGMPAECAPASAQSMAVVVRHQRGGHASRQRSVATSASGWSSIR